MPLFRRRAGRHAAGMQAATPAVPWTPGPRVGEPRTEPLPRERVVPTGPVPADGRVRLGFSDGSAVTLAADDPRARAFRALAKELGRRD